MTLGKQVLLFFSKEDSEDKKETLLKLLYKVEMKKEGTKEVDHRVGSDIHSKSWISWIEKSADDFEFSAERSSENTKSIKITLFAELLLINSPI